MTNERLYHIIETHGKEYAYSLISKEITAYRDQGNNGLARATERQWEIVCSYTAVSTIPPIIKKPTKARRFNTHRRVCLLYTSPSPRDRTRSRMPSSA